MGKNQLYYGDNLDVLKKSIQVLVSVKGGKTVTPSFARDFRGTVERQTDAHMGVLVTMGPITKGVREEIDHGGVFVHPGSSVAYPRMQHVSIPELLAGNLPKMPPLKLPYIPASKILATDGTETLF
jgi:hypothetical protein